jgi:Mg-chelatase subunit ChlD
VFLKSLFFFQKLLEQQRQLAELERQRQEFARQQQLAQQLAQQRQQQEELQRQQALLAQQQAQAQQLQMAAEIARMKFFQQLQQQSKEGIGARDYVLFIDKSGSMAGSRWQEARKV